MGQTQVGNPYEQSNSEQSTQPTRKIVQVLSVHLGNSGYVISRGHGSELFHTTFPGKGITSLVDVSPFRIVSGRISHTICDGKIWFVAADMSGWPQEYHAVHIPYHEHSAPLVHGFKVTVGVPDQIWRPVLPLRPSISGKNPFTSKPDIVQRISNLLLYNDDHDPVPIYETAAVTMTLVIEVPSYALECSEIDERNETNQSADQSRTNRKKDDKISNKNSKKGRGK